MDTTPSPVLLHWHDCEVDSVHLHGTELVLLLSAAHVSGWRMAHDGDALAGYLAPVSVSLRLRDAMPRAPEAWGRIAHGRIEIDGSFRTSVPLGAGAAQRIELDFANGTHLDLALTHYECRVEPQARFVESLAC